MSTTPITTKIKPISDKIFARPPSAGAYRAAMYRIIPNTRTITPVMSREVSMMYTIAIY